MILQVGTPFGVIGFSSMFDWGRETAVFQKPNMAETIVVGKWVTLVGPQKLRIDPESWESVEWKRLGFLIFSIFFPLTSDDLKYPPLVCSQTNRCSVLLHLWSEHLHRRHQRYILQRDGAGLSIINLSSQDVVRGSQDGRIWSWNW